MLVGADTLDDAAVTRWPGSDALLIQTIDVITPVVDDPSVFGRIAAANALSDVYAMGGVPRFALVFAALPGAMDPAVARAILAGGAATVADAGALIVGGHTIKDDIPKYGLAVIGEVAADALRSNAGGRPGDRLVLTQPLGAGLAYSAYRAQTLSPGDTAAWIAGMARLNDVAARIAARPSVHAMTDVTGFGLVGHGMQLGKASGCGVILDPDALPVLPGTWTRAAAAGFGGGAGRNLRYAAPDLPQTPAVRVMADPQTSGGLLIAVDPADCADLCAALAAAGQTAAVVGRLTAGVPGRVALSAGE